MKIKLYVDDVLRETTTGKTIGVYDSEAMTLKDILRMIPVSL